MARRYARNNAEAARLGIPTWYQAKRSKAAAQRAGIPQRVLRGHAPRGESILDRRFREAGFAEGRPTIPLLVAGTDTVIAYRPRTLAQARLAGRITGEYQSILSGGFPAADLRADASKLGRVSGRVLNDPAGARPRTAGGEVETDPDRIGDLAPLGRLDPILEYRAGRSTTPAAA